MCACRCGIRVHLRDGEVRYIEGNPDHPLNQGVICAKGSSGIMKQYSPARLTSRCAQARRGARRGRVRGDLLGRGLRLLTERLGKIRATDPKKFALFTGRDQMQALTGLFARQFGTPNYAAHGGFCSVNMAAGMIYTIGGSFWEFGGPDLDRAKLFVMIGTAEDHHSNPLKIAISQVQARGGRFVSINPVRTGYSAIADEWVPIKPGTDGALLLALIHEIIAARPLRPRLPRPLHQRRAAGESTRPRRVRHVLRWTPTCRWTRAATRPAQQAVVGPAPRAGGSPTPGADPRCWALHGWPTAPRSSRPSSC
jgi:anaerobic selenocysteine-containing dehydrogenase